jgi:hypothetical protein
VEEVEEAAEGTGEWIACVSAEAAMTRFPLDTDEDPARTPPQTESSEERGLTDEDVPPDFGDTEELDDMEGDIADEGPGHRG